jgi:hypothetical protein
MCGTSAAAIGARGSIAPHLLAGPVRKRFDLAMHVTHDGPHHIETSTRQTRERPAPLAAQDCARNGV